MDIREKLKKGPLLFDGAMGTYYAEHGGSEPTCELANLSDPETVFDIHRQYIEAGCDAIKTNTFSLSPAALDCDEKTSLALLDAGWEIACRAARGTDTAVFADLGPIPVDENAGGSLPVYITLIDRFLALGAKNFLFETFSSMEYLPQICAHVKASCPDSFIICSFAAMADGFTQTGALCSRIFANLSENESIDALGLNCLASPSHMKALMATLPDTGKPLSIMPNAGYPANMGGRSRFSSSAIHFAALLADIAFGGADIVGGCCGTTPDCIRMARREMEAGSITRRVAEKISAQPAKKTSVNRLEQKLKAGKPVIAVELDPPANADADAFIKGARELKAAGVDAITIADCPISRPRADSSVMACKLKRELDLDVIPHMTCRDRNINATKALLLGLNIEGVNNVLVVSGDPVPSADRSRVKSVYNFNSPVLAGFIRDLGTEISPFFIFGGLDVNAANFDAHLKHAKNKIASGVTAFCTQPVLSALGLENLKRAKKELDAYILCGLMPIVSQRNANYLNNEISGITVCDEIVALYEGLDREQAEEVAVKVTCRIAREAKPYCHGFYLITPFTRTGLVGRIIEKLKADEI